MENLVFLFENYHPLFWLFSSVTSILALNSLLCYNVCSNKEAVVKIYSFIHWMVGFVTAYGILGLVIVGFCFLNSHAGTVIYTTLSDNFFWLVGSLLIVGFSYAVTVYIYNLAKERIKVKPSVTGLVQIINKDLLARKIKITSVDEIGDENIHWHRPLKIMMEISFDLLSKFKNEPLFLGEIFDFIVNGINSSNIENNLEISDEHEGKLIKDNNSIVAAAKIDNWSFLSLEIIDNNHYALGISHYYRGVDDQPYSKSEKYIKFSYVDIT